MDLHFVLWVKNQQCQGLETDRLFFESWFSSFKRKEFRLDLDFVLWVLC